MGELLGLGLTHFPPLGWPDDMMDRALQFAFADPSGARRRSSRARAGPRACARSSTATGSRRRPSTASALVRGCDHDPRRARRVRARRRGDLGRRPVRAVPRGRRACVLRDRRRHVDVRSRGAIARATRSPNVWEEDPRHDVRAPRPHGVRQAPRRPRCSHDDVDVAYAYGPRDRPAVPARDRQHGDVPRLPPTRVPVSRSSR